MLFEMSGSECFWQNIHYTSTFGPPAAHTYTWSFISAAQPHPCDILPRRSSNDGSQKYVKSTTCVTHFAARKWNIILSPQRNKFSKADGVELVVLGFANTPRPITVRALGKLNYF